ncbi:MAG: S9 family peptidase [Acidobacteria bacterium]|nr:S9 family peptidase [Acidobacteriota bacterium]
MRLWLTLLLFCLPTPLFGVDLQDDGPLDPRKLTLEEVYTVKPFRGKTPRMIRFTEDDRYFAFLWNPYEETGYDLYVYDMVAHRLQQVTSLERMKNFDPPEDHQKFVDKDKQRKEEEAQLQELFFAQRDYLDGKDVDLFRFEMEEIEELKKELEEERQEKEKKKAGAENTEERHDVQKDEKDSGKEEKKQDKKEEEKKELELWELRDKLQEKKEHEKIKPGDLYPGVRNYAWSKLNPELIFVYRGDLYRYFPQDDTIRRLTMSDDQENLVAYTPAGDGYYFSRGNQVFRVMFDSSYLHQINHQFREDDKKDDDKDKAQLKLYRTSIAPDGEWMMVIGAKQKGKPAMRDVIITDFQKRFAEASKVKRQVADDKRNEPEYQFFLRPVTEINYGPEPVPVFTIPGGDIWYEFSDIEWSEDGTRYAFMTWEREKGDLKIWIGDAAAEARPKILYETKEKIGFKSFYQRNVKFTPDGQQLAAVLNNEKGFRQPVLFDLASGERRELIKGEFESYPILDFSPDGRFMYVQSDLQDPAMDSVYRVTVATGEMTRIGKTGGMHRETAVSSDGEWIASVYGNWDMRPELYLMDTKAQTDKLLTQSHREDWEKFNFIKPAMFKFKNRHGDTISGMIFKPEGWRPEDRRPGIVHVYGGPLLTRHTVETDNFSTLSYIFQMMMAVQHGYVTVAIDPRGQSGFGRRFSEANWENPGQTQVEDLEDLVKHLENGFGVDIDRLGLHGWSFGGYQTLKTMFSSPDTFACGIAVASVTEWENYNSWYAGSTIGPSVRGKPSLRKYSLLPLAKNLKNPLLLVHGMMDPNVLYQDTLKVYQALLEAGKETLVDLFLDPTGKHGLNGIVKNKAIYKKFQAFFLEHLGSFPAE